MKLPDEVLMCVTIKPGSLRGTLIAPASKSAMQRACALALLHEGSTKIYNPGVSNDDVAALSIIEALGAIVQKEEDHLYVKGSPFFKDDVEAKRNIFCGESGLSIRMFTPIAALSTAEVEVHGAGSLQRRPMHFFDEVLPQLGVTVHSCNGYLPMKLKGPLQANPIQVDGSLSSQFLTGLLIAFARAAKAPVHIAVHDLKSKPYIDLTLHMMSLFGYEVQHEDYIDFHIHPKTPNTQTIDYTVEGDWSGAAFLLVAGAMAGEVTVQGLDLHSTQADKKILEVLHACGARLSIHEHSITVGKAALHSFDIDATDCPDLFPPLVALAAFCKGKSVIHGVHRLQHKESNRALTLQEEFGKMGLNVILQGNMMIVEGGHPLHSAKVKAHHDHRIAMALAVAALQAEGETEIENAEAINKSYPAFYEHLQSLGASITATVSS